MWRMAEEAGEKKICLEIFNWGLNTHFIGFGGQKETFNAPELAYKMTQTLCLCQVCLEG